jgi:hypothetical protein
MVLNTIHSLAASTKPSWEKSIGFVVLPKIIDAVQWVVLLEDFVWK